MYYLIGVHNNVYALLFHDGEKISPYKDLFSLKYHFTKKYDVLY